MSTKIHKLIILNLFSKLKFLGCYTKAARKNLTSLSRFDN